MPCEEFFFYSFAHFDKQHSKSISYNLNERVDSSRFYFNLILQISKNKLYVGYREG